MCLAPTIQLKTLKQRSTLGGGSETCRTWVCLVGRDMVKNPNCLLKQRTQSTPPSHCVPSAHVCVCCTSKAGLRIRTLSFKAVFLQLCGFFPFSKYFPFLIEVWKESESEVAQLCLTLCNPMDCSPRGSSVHGIFQARVLKWAAIAFSRGSSRPRDRTWVSWISGRRFTVWATREAPIEV